MATVTEVVQLLTCVTLLASNAALLHVRFVKQSYWKHICISRFQSKLIHSPSSL